MTKGFIFTAPSCVVWAEFLWSLLRTGRKTDSGWELLMQVPTKDGNIGVQSHYLNCPSKGLEALANYVQWVTLRLSAQSPCGPSPWRLASINGRGKGKKLMYLEVSESFLSSGGNSPVFLASYVQVWDLNKKLRHSPPPPM